MEKKKVPEIRFEGFNDDWEQYKLKDIANKVNEKNVNLSVSETFTNSAEYGVISQRDFFDHDISNVENIGGYYIVGEDNFVYNPRISVTAPVGPINRNKLGRKGIMSPLYTIFRIHDIDPIFLEYFFKGNTWHSYMYFNGDTGARFDRFSIKNEVFFDMPISYPQFEEQKIIGRYLDYLDHLVTLYQCKYEKLKLFKETILNKMFPKNEEKIPEIRFRGFTDDWEQRKLEEVFTIRNEQNDNRYTREDVLAVSDNYGCVNQIKFHGRSFAGEDISNYKVVRTGDIVYTKSPLQAKPYGIIKIVGEETGIISPLYVVNETVNGIDSMFMYYLFDTPERTNNYLSPLVRKGAKNTMNISNEEWLSGEVTISPNEQEQKAIGTFFFTLDRLITLHRHKYEKLKLFKEAMFNKMFI